MSEHVEFRVDEEMPPKKDGANSMRAKPTEFPRLIALRSRALEAMRSRRRTPGSSGIRNGWSQA
jgi:hypothetical protein